MGGADVTYVSCRTRSSRQSPGFRDPCELVVSVDHLRSLQGLPYIRLSWATVEYDPEVLQAKEVLGTAAPLAKLCFSLDPFEYQVDHI